MRRDGTGDGRRGGRAAVAAMAAGGLALVVGLGACGGDPPTEPAASALQTDGSPGDETRAKLSDRLDAIVGLDDGQRESLETSLAAWRDRAGEPGASWALAVDVEGILSPDQVALLADAGHSGRRGAGRTGTARMERRSPHRSFEGLDLTDEQRSEIREIFEASRPELSELRAQVRSGELDREAARARADEIRESVHAAIDALLSPGQRDELAARRAETEARRETRRAERQERAGAARDAMIDALGLTPEQVERLVALREAGRAAREDGVERDDLRAAHRAELAEILSEEQNRVLVVHRWLIGAGGPGSGVRSGARTRGAGAPRANGPRPGGAGPGPGPAGGFFGG